MASAREIIWDPDTDGRRVDVVAGNPLLAGDASVRGNPESVWPMASDALSIHSSADPDGVDSSASAVTTVVSWLRDALLWPEIGRCHHFVVRRVCDA